MSGLRGEDGPQTRRWANVAQPGLVQPESGASPRFTASTHLSQALLMQSHLVTRGDAREDERRGEGTGTAIRRAQPTCPVEPEPQNLS